MVFVSVMSDSGRPQRQIFTAKNIEGSRGWGSAAPSPDAGRVKGRAPTPRCLPAGPGDLPRLRPRLLLPAVLPAAEDLPAVPPGHQPARPDLPQQLSARPAQAWPPAPSSSTCRPRAQLTPCSSQNSTAHSALGPSPPPTSKHLAGWGQGVFLTNDLNTMEEEEERGSLMAQGRALGYEECPGQCGSATPQLPGRSLSL